MQQDLFARLRPPVDVRASLRYHIAPGLQGVLRDPMKGPFGTSLVQQQVRRLLIEKNADDLSLLNHSVFMMANAHWQDVSKQVGSACQPELKRTYAARLAQTIRPADEVGGMPARREDYLSALGVRFPEPTRSGDSTPKNWVRFHDALLHFKSDASDYEARHESRARLTLRHFWNFEDVLEAGQNTLVSYYEVPASLNQRFNPLYFHRKSDTRLQEARLPSTTLLTTAIQKRGDEYGKPPLTAEFYEPHADARLHARVGKLPLDGLMLYARSTGTFPIAVPFEQPDQGASNIAATLRSLIAYKEALAGPFSFHKRMQQKP